MTHSKLSLILQAVYDFHCPLLQTEQNSQHIYAAKKLTLQILPSTREEAVYFSISMNY